MAFARTNCPIVLLPAELVRKLCSYLTPDAVCRLEQTCSQLQDSMNQPTIWKKQVESFPVSGIPFGDSSEATYSKLGFVYRVAALAPQTKRKRWDYFNWRLLKHFYSVLKQNFERYGWDNPYRVALRTKFTIDKLLIDVQNFEEDEVDEALGKLKEEANLNPDRDWNYRYPLKIWQVTVELDHSKDWDFECLDYLNKWMVHGGIPGRGRIDCKLYNEKNVFKIESYVYHDNLVNDESDSEDENDSSDDENHDTEGEEEGFEGFDNDNDNDSNTDEEEEGVEDLE